MSILFNVWMLPILFILHDFEEMIVMPLWKIRHHQNFAVYFWILPIDSQQPTLFIFCSSVYISFHNPLYHVPAI